VRDRAERIASLARILTDEQLDAVVPSCRHIDEHHRCIKAAIA
jgi:hypothetical protein